MARKNPGPNTMDCPRCGPVFLRRVHPLDNGGIILASDAHYAITCCMCGALIKTTKGDDNAK